MDSGIVSGVRGGVLCASDEEVRAGDQVSSSAGSISSRAGAVMARRVNVLERNVLVDIAHEDASE